jgi:hypothetical protein
VGFEAAVAAYTEGRFEDAAAGFRDVISRCGGRDGPSSLYLERIDAAVRPLPDDWDGVLTFTKK